MISKKEESYSKLIEHKDGSITLNEPMVGKNFSPYKKISKKTGKRR